MIKKQQEFSSKSEKEVRSVTVGLHGQAGHDAVVWHVVSVQSPQLWFAELTEPQGSKVMCPKSPR